MKTKMYFLLSAIFILTSTPVFSADDDSDKMKIEKIISTCEDQYPEDKYPDADERNKLVDKCIEENSPSSAQQE